MCPHLKLGVRSEVRSELVEREPRSLPDLVAEEAVALHAQHVQVDVAALTRVGHQREAERVRAALGDALRIVS